MVGSGCLYAYSALTGSLRTFCLLSLQTCYGKAKKDKKDKDELSEEESGKTFKKKPFGKGVPLTRKGKYFDTLKNAFTSMAALQKLSHEELNKIKEKVKMEEEEKEKLRRQGIIVTKDTKIKINEKSPEGDESKTAPVKKYQPETKLSRFKKKEAFELERIRSYETRPKSTLPKMKISDMEKYLITGKDRIKEMEDKQEIPKYNKNNQNIKPFDLKKHPTKLNKREKLIVLEYTMSAMLNG